MAQNLAPWIAEYLVDVAETHGGSLGGVPTHTKGRKVQLLEFLTFGDSEHDDCIWAVASDKHQKIAVRFSQDAIARYMAEHQQDSQGRRLTEQRYAIATLKRFRPLFQRVPTGRGKMTAGATLALAVDAVDVVGAAGEPEFGSARPLDMHADIKEWMSGLRAGGGGGNVLKLRKAETLALERGEPAPADPARSTSGVPVAEREARQSAEKDAAESRQGPAVAIGQEEWRQSLAKKPLRFYRRPAANGVQASKPPPAAAPTNETPILFSPLKRKRKLSKGVLDLDSSQPPAPTPVAAAPASPDDAAPRTQPRQTTPTDWASSPAPSRVRFSTSPERRSASPQLQPQPSTPPVLTPSQPPSPAPAPAKPPTPTPSLDPHPAAAAEASLPAPTPAQRPRTTSPAHTHTHTTAPSLPRRVPLPAVKRASAARGEILVPGSDSTGSGTQPRAPPPPPDTSPGPARVDDTFDAASSPARAPPGELSRMAQHGSHPPLQPPRGGASQLPPSSLPPSSLPPQTQTPARSTTLLVDETPAPPRKRPRSPSPAPAPRKRARWPDAPEPRAQGHDPELLALGIAVDLADYARAPPAWGADLRVRSRGAAHAHPLLLTNGKLAEIWQSVCAARGWA
ncbi:hypothetical protein BC834DRAFT_1045411 [Gloeopeniophorella convolvens]|nr:hypothetical protein BC834DRAFT_1045411 [Gloeopeniophorella convolvens]